MLRCLAPLAILGIAVATAAIGLASPVSKSKPNVEVVNALSNGDQYIAPTVIAKGHARSGDQKRVEGAIQAAGKRGVTVKVALVNQYPHKYRTVQDAANRLRTFIDFSGVLVLVSPHGLGVSSDLMSDQDIRSVVRRSSPLSATSYSNCAIRAVKASVPYVKANESAANRNVAIFWLVAVVIFGVAIVALVLFARQRQQKLIEGWSAQDDQAEPAGNTTK